MKRLPFISHVFYKTNVALFKGLPQCSGSWSQLILDQGSHCISYNHTMCKVTDFFLEKLLEGFDISSANWKKNFVDFSELWLAWCVRSSWHFWDGVTSSQRLSWNMPSIRCNIERTNFWSLWWKVFKVFKIQYWATADLAQIFQT